MPQQLNVPAWLALRICFVVAWCGCLDPPNLESVPRPPDDAPADDGLRLSVLTWNVAWLGDAEAGPDDEDRQLRGVIDTLGAFPCELVALQEVASPDSLRSILLALPDYAVVESAYDWPQQVALLYRRSHFDLEAFEEWRDAQSAGRAPLSVGLYVRPLALSVRVVVIHAKANTDLASYQERSRFAERLRERLQRDHATDRLILAGDFNDQITGSIIDGLPSPYASLAQGLLSVPTAELERADEPSTIWGSVVDHIAITRPLSEAAGWSASANVLRDEAMARDKAFSSAVSDHFPVRLVLRQKP